MPIFLASLLGGLVAAAGSIAGRVLISLGVGFISFSGVDATIDYIVSQIHTASGSLPSLVLAGLGLLQFDNVVGIMVAAVTSKMVLTGLQSGAVKKMIFK
jgi:hypothetical protein